MSRKNGNNVLSMPKVQLGFAQARAILRDLGNHDADQIDAAFDVLVYSPHHTDMDLCHSVVEYMMERNRPKQNWTVVLVVMSVVVVVAVSLAAILVEVLL